MVSGNLILGSAREVDLDELRSLPVHAIETRSFKPMAHHELVDTVLDQADAQGLEVESMRLGVSNGADKMPVAKFFGMLFLASVITEGVKVIIGLRNALDKSRSAAMGLGGQVMVCENEDIHADVVIFRRHTTNIRRDIPSLIWSGLRRIPEFADDRARQIETMKSRFMSVPDSHDLLIRAYDAGAIGIRELPKVLAEFRKVENDERFGECNLWNNYNAFTETKKVGFQSHGRGAQDAATQTIALNNLLAQQYGIN